LKLAALPSMLSFRWRRFGIMPREPVWKILKLF
jgi:hypothetical protein